MDPSLLPPPSWVARAFRELLGAGLLGEVRVTLTEVCLAFVIAAPLAVGTGLLLGEKLFLGGLVNPLIYLIAAIPQSVFLPLFILAFGVGTLQKVIFGITHAFFVIVINTVAGMKGIPPPLILTVRSFGATPWQLYRQVYLPWILPMVAVGLRTGMIFNIVGIIIAEMYVSKRGLGHLIDLWGRGFQIPELLAVIGVVSAMTIAINELMRAWEARVSRWRL